MGWIIQHHNKSHDYNYEFGIVICCMLIQIIHFFSYRPPHSMMPSELNNSWTSTILRLNCIDCCWFAPSMLSVHWTLHFYQWNSYRDLNNASHTQGIVFTVIQEYTNIKRTVIAEWQDTNIVHFCSKSIADRLVTCLSIHYILLLCSLQMCTTVHMYIM